MKAEFEEFARTLEERGHAPQPKAEPMTRMTVLGGGAEAQVYAARALAGGADVALFSAYGAELDRFSGGGSIALRGDGPVGNYNVNQPGVPSIATSSSLDQVIEAAELLVFTGPVHKQRAYAMALAEHFRDGQVVFLPNARTFGAIEVAWLMRAGGCRADVTIVDMPGAPFFAEATGEGIVVHDRPPQHAATLPAGRPEILEAVACATGTALALPNALASGMVDGSGLVDAIGLLLGGPGLADGRPELVHGATPLTAHDTFRNLLGEAHCDLLAGAWAERVEVARAFGVRGMPDAAAVVEAHAGAPEGAASRPIPAAELCPAMLRDAAIGSISPLLSAAKLAGKSVPLNRSLMTMTSRIVGGDLESAGRRLDQIGIHQDNIDDARRAVEGLMA